MNRNRFLSTRKSTSQNPDRQNISNLEAPTMNKKSYTHAFKLVLVVLAFVLFGTSAMTLPAHAQANTVPAPCITNCIRVTNIALERKDSPAAPKITATVTIAMSPSVDTTALGGALVYAKWTLPNGTTVLAFGTTNANGQAVFQINGTPGTFTFTIINVTKSHFVFDRYNSVLSASIH